MNRSDSRLPTFAGVLLATTLAFGGCTTFGNTTSSPTDKASSVEAIEFSVSRYADRSLSKVHGQQTHSEIVVVMPLLRGSMFSGKRITGRIVIDTHSSGVVRLDEKSGLTHAISRAREKRDEPNLADLHLNPTETRFLRLGTLVNYADRRVYSYSQFRDQISGNALFLTYFDRPCSLRGTVITGFQSEWSVDIPKEGFYWLMASRIDHDVYQFDLAGSGVQPELRYFLDDERVFTP